MDHVPVIDLSRQWAQVKAQSMVALERVLDQGHYILGTEVSELETEVAKQTGNPYGIAVANGTDALTLALQALGIGHGDEVITTPFTFFATAEAILQVGATPVFVDVDPLSFTITAEAIEAKITPRTKAILPVHIFGLMPNMEKIRRVADSRGLFIVEDACQAIGAQWNGKGIGAYSDAVALSFFPTKNLGGYGDGGMVLVSDEHVARRIKRLRVHGSSQKYVHVELGWNSRLDELQAALLRIKLKHLDAWTQERRELAERYHNALSSYPLQLPLAPAKAHHVYHLYTVLVENRESLKQHLAQQGIGSSVYYPVPLHLQPALANLKLSQGTYPVAEALCNSCLSLPLFPGMTEEQQNRVIEAIDSYFAR